MTPAGKQFGVSRRATGFQGPLASALSPGGTKLLSLSSGASRSNSADLFDMRTRKRSSFIRYDARRGIGEAVFYGVTMSPDGSRAWASGGGQDVVHAYAVGPTPARGRDDPGAELPGRHRVRHARRTGTGCTSRTTSRAAPATRIRRATPSR